MRLQREIGWSEREDLNLRPLAPHPTMDGLPAESTRSYASKVYSLPRAFATDSKREHSFATGTTRGGEKAAHLGDVEIALKAQGE